MWDEPYLETCCRAALHRVRLSGAAGRPAGYKDGPCLMRLADRGWVTRRGDARYEITAAGLRCHGQVIRRRPSR
jgi:hypothetical protein